MYFIVVEDDNLQLDLLSQGLREAFSGLKLMTFRTEKEFRGALESLAMTPPDVVIIDIMLKWTEPSRDFESPPPDVKEGKFHRAGFRCQKLLERGDKTREIPVILYSVVDLEEYLGERTDLPENVRILSKEHTLDLLVTTIKEMTNRAKSTGAPSAG